MMKFIAALLNSNSGIGNTFGVYSFQSLKSAELVFKCASSTMKVIFSSVMRGLSSPNHIGHTSDTSHAHAGQGLKQTAQVSDVDCKEDCRLALHGTHLPQVW
jgi:hypothetical protein